MIDPTQITVTQPYSGWKIGLDILQVVATLILAWVAIAQAKAANNQARAAEIQARAALTNLKQSLRPRFTPSRWEANENGAGGKLVLQNVGRGPAHAIRWHFDREWHWIDADDLISEGDSLVLNVLSPLAGREIVVEYFSAEEELYVTKIDAEKELHFSCIDPVSGSFISKLRDRQQGR